MLHVTSIAIGRIYAPSAGDATYKYVINRSECICCTSKFDPSCHKKTCRIQTAWQMPSSMWWH